MVLGAADVPADSEMPVVTSSVSKICRFSFSDVLTGIELRACIHRDVCAYVFVSSYVCTLF